MSDFLDQLVARSVSRTAEIRPQVYSRYESLPLNGGAILGGGDMPEFGIGEGGESLETAADGQAASRIHGDAAAANLATARQGAPPSSAPPKAPDQATGNLAERLAQLEAFWRSGRAQSPENSRPASLESTGAAVPGVEQRPREPGGRETGFPVISATEERRGIVARSGNGGVTASVRPAPPDARAEMFPIGSNPPPGRIAPADGASATDSPATRSTLREPSVAPQPALSSPPASPAAVVPAQIVPSPRILPQPATREREEEGPSIHVTIGRVEVRATSAVEPRATRARTPSTAPTLDEYLRRRGRGGGAR